MSIAQKREEIYILAFYSSKWICGDTMPNLSKMFVSVSSEYMFYFTWLLPQNCCQYNNKHYAVLYACRVTSVSLSFIKLFLNEI